MNVVIMRGLPGSGKTTWVQELKGEKIICSADDFHMIEGEYRYNPKKAGEAHDWCLKKFLSALLKRETDTLVVDNTNTTLIEIAAYARLASAFGISFKIVYIYCDLALAHLRCVHGVPIATMLKMKHALDTEQVPSYWPQEIIIK